MIEHQKTTRPDYITKGRGFSCEAATRLQQERRIRDRKASEQGSFEHSKKLPCKTSRIHTIIKHQMMFIPFSCSCIIAGCNVTPYYNLQY